MLVYGSKIRAGGSKREGEDGEIRGLLARASIQLDVKMKIWLDTAPHFHHKNNDCADCTDPRVLPDPITKSLLEDGVAAVQGLALEHTIPLYVQPCNEERWLVC